MTNNHQHIDASSKTDSPSSSHTKTQQRKSSIELLRIISATAIVLYHIEGSPFKKATHSGLICFIIIATIFQIDAKTQRPLVFFKKRTIRILTPWGFWGCIYFTLNLATNKKAFPYSNGVINDILTGPWIGLWFFPFILATSLATHLTTTTFREKHKYTKITTYAILTCIALYAFKASNPTEPPWSQWLHALPSIPLSFLIRESIEPTKKIVLPLLVTLFTFISCATIAPELTTTYTLATFAVAIAFSANNLSSKAINKTSILCLGVYVTHSIFIRISNKLIPQEFNSTLTIFLAATSMSFITAYLLSKTYLRRIIT
ncbi:acyltransferase family protein [Pelagicoccus sp. SDUM812005]|uniref:acyltransferase family protein n=1 Tax=Pelagicoccus sp. SDUM812005 TaxID=3041257 RepID=UPI00280FD18F|nr:acyltransferase family protein [Pelagicoccus sp. SDUM812005]MDQ8183737.1 hypothetical protein [Pelagicoccus sp. SDUM812005]